MKKTASKGDKKKKKEVTEEIAKLEYEMNERHDKEMAELKSNEPVPQKENEQVSQQF